MLFFLIRKTNMWTIHVLQKKKCVYIYNCMQIKSNLSCHSLIDSSLSQSIVSGSGALNLEHSVTSGHRLSWMTTCTSGRDTCNPCRDMPTWAVPEQRWFSLTHSLFGRSAPDGNDGLGSGHAEHMRGGPLLM